MLKFQNHRISRLYYHCKIETSSICIQFERVKKGKRVIKQTIYKTINTFENHVSAVMVHSSIFDFFVSSYDLCMTHFRTLFSIDTDICINIKYCTNNLDKTHNTVKKIPFCYF